VTSYNASFSVDGHTLTSSVVFNGNSDQNTIVTNQVSPAVSARYVRIYPLKYSSWPSLRACVGTAASVQLLTPPVSAAGTTTCQGVYSATTEIAAPPCLSAKAQINSTVSWCALVAGKSTDFLQIDLGSSQDLVDIFTQGRADAGWWVTSYTVFVSDDGFTLTQVGGIFEGNHDQQTIVGHNLVGHGRYIRIYPLGYYGSTSLRVCVQTANSVPALPQLASSDACPGTYTASSQYSETDCYAQVAKTSLPSNAWCAASPGTLKDYLQIDLQTSQYISAISTKGRVPWTQWVSSYYVYVSTDGQTYNEVGGLFRGNNDTTSVVTNTLGVTARCVRIYPSAFWSWTSIRACLVTGSQ